MKKSSNFFLLFLMVFCSGQNAFHVLRKELDKKIQNSDYPTALELINQNREHYNSDEKTNLDVSKVKILTELGLYDEAFKLSQNLINSKLTPEQQLKIHIERELIFEINNDEKSSKIEIDKAEQLIKNHPDLKPKNYTHFLIRKSSYYRVNGHREIAFEIANEAKKYAMSVNDESNLPDVELILGLGNRNNPEKRLAHFQRALYLYKRLHHNEAINSMYNNISFLYFSKQDYKMADVYIDSAIANSKNSRVLNYRADIFQLKSEIMEKQNQPDSALHYYKLTSGLYNQFNNQQIDLKVKELGIQFNFQKEKTEKEQLQKNIAGTRKLNITLFISVFVLACLIWLILKNKKKIEVQKQEISDNNLALKNNLEQKQFLVQELNHRVKNNLAVILSLIDFQKDQADSSEYKNRFEDLHQRIKTIMIVHELYSYSVNHNDNALIEVESYTNRIFETHQNSSQRVIDYKIDIENSTLKVDKALPFGLILNELITNSIKHAKTESLILDLKLNLIDDKIELSYSDNGTNFDFENKKDSLGLLIIEGMVKQLKGNYTRDKANYKITFPND
ncbi:sensor histidine kinase [Epilithonimonas zeae]|uniref:sensor histidine kinase n=1 Tax=Epilithonimonas zeae TaxID=1416779 RepID=UPI00200BD2C2|nr:sensor histidine kinase [Epilithonimonas zeae]UQB68846.1 sensor histidine kinase [Epilithonimonas zeae]